MPHLSRMAHRARISLATAVAGGLIVSGAAIAPSIATASPAQRTVSQAAPSVQAATITRAEMLRRAAIWLTANNGVQVPYSQTSIWSDGYRQDCSGYVSMTLGLSKPGPNTVELAGNSSLTTPISLSSLTPGDLLIDATGTNTTRHVVIFAGWTDSSHTAYDAYEQRGGHGTDHRVLTYGLDSGSEFKPYRPVNLSDSGTPTPSWPSLSNGSSGVDVEAAQHLLTGRGYTTTADGSFGAATLTQVKAFQSANGLSADGVIGDQTWSKLISTVSTGASGDAVLAVQTELNAQGYGLTVDGSFGSSTDSAVRSFQGKQSLAVDGVVGPQTWVALIGS